MRDEVGWRVARRDLDRHRRVQQFLRQPAHFLGKSSGEQKVLALPRQLGEDALDVRNEPHVEHPVSFVEHQEFDSRQVDALLVQMIEQPAWCRHHDFHAGVELLHLRSDVHAAEHHCRAQRQVLAVGAHAFLDLRREFARGGQHQHAHRMPGRRQAGIGLRRDKLQEGQGEAGGFAGAGLGRAHDVPPLQNWRYCLGLYRRRLQIAFVRDCTQQFGQQPEGGEGRSGSVGRAWLGGCSAVLYRGHDCRLPPVGRGKYSFTDQDYTLLRCGAL